jgi:hypothetical protein
MMDFDVVRNASDVLPLNLRIIKIVEIVEDGHFVTGGKQLFGKMRSDKTGATGDENSHGVRLATDKDRSTQISDLR